VSFSGRRKNEVKFTAVVSPAFFNYKHAAFLLIGGKPNLEKFGELGEQLEQEAEKEKETMTDQTLLKELHLPATEHQSAVKELV